MRKSFIEFAWLFVIYFGINENVFGNGVIVIVLMVMKEQNRIATDYRFFGFSRRVFLIFRIGLGLQSIVNFINDMFGFRFGRLAHYSGSTYTGKRH